MAGTYGFNFPKFQTVAKTPTYYPTTTQATPAISPTTSTMPQLWGTQPPPPTVVPPPPLPELPQQSNQYLSLLQALLGQFQNYNPYPGLAPDMLQALGKQTTAQKSNAELTFRDAFDKAIADLYGRNVERSTIATDATGRLATEKANVMAQIEGDAAQREMALRQYMGQQGLASLGAQGNLIGTGATLEQQGYNSLVNAILQRAGLANQQYGIQQGAATNNDQLSQQWAMMQQQFLQNILQQFLGQMSPNMFGSPGSTVGFNTGSIGNPAYGNFGIQPGSTGSGTTGNVPIYQKQYDPQVQQQQQFADNPYYKVLDQILFQIFGRHFFQ